MCARPAILISNNNEVCMQNKGRGPEIIYESVGGVSMNSVSSRIQTYVNVFIFEDRVGAQKSFTNQWAKQAWMSNHLLIVGKASVDIVIFNNQAQSTDQWANRMGMHSKVSQNVGRGYVWSESGWAVTSPTLMAYWRTHYVVEAKGLQMTTERVDYKVYAAGRELGTFAALQHIQAYTCTLHWCTWQALSKSVRIHYDMKNVQMQWGKAPCACIAARLSHLCPTCIHDLAIVQTASHMPNSVAYIMLPPSELDGMLLGALVTWGSEKVIIVGHCNIHLLVMRGKAERICEGPEEMLDSKGEKSALHSEIQMPAICPQAKLKVVY
ncbi:hypothetical protein F5J12DRAFT_785427 [Pisolithus orientalis]|uniref:uncharacterized protein n=1 Tax=Pisolithus orientalis TaxID=936130 RepID=UPI0022244A53|nr:uncharacterized protein F5J12DRAFT_785427 [Pisolithus orientalis]KAI5996459.1 hypothetical protein F5J12DRAFT_785427 [Pisolithus orientalis]